jgi:hypothetical protein
MAGRRQRLGTKYAKYPWIRPSSWSRLTLADRGFHRTARNPESHTPSPKDALVPTAQALERR